MTSNLEYFIKTPAAWSALVSWSKFSITSFRMVASLSQQGIVPQTVIDVGANVGQFAVACAKLFRGVTVYSFEPLPECLVKLKRNVAMFHSVHVYPVALGERIADVAFHVNSYSHSSSILALEARHRRAFPYATEIDTIMVRLSTLDCEMESIVLEGPVLLKLDVQGYEMQVLEGATGILKGIDYVLVEVSFRPMYEGERTFMEIVRAMDDRGFEFLRPVAWLTDPRSGEVLQADALFARHGYSG